MQFSECGKRAATLHLTQNINGQKSEIHVCDICAQKKGYIQQKEEPYSIQELLSELFHFDPASFDIQSKEWLNKTEQLECQSCHLSLQEYQNKIKFGAPQFITLLAIVSIIFSVRFTLGIRSTMERFLNVLVIDCINNRK